MKLTRLRITGFKTFVEPTEFHIEPGLTGIVGPNGCGKSNLVEALRWVMGENSFKNMRASGMDDVIFSGSGGRPARNMAEVGLTIDNSARTAPAAFNDSDVLDVSRRIEREDGSAYRINGREVRARDVQLLFADAATGSRSPALVRQGQISEIISAKPQARRRILEDAAGIAGLHSRRHEAELRLRGAEDNLVRLEDVIGAISGQIESLRKQARQAGRYRALAAEIRQAEALIAAIQHADARLQVATAQRTLEAAIRDVAERTRLQSVAARDQAVAAQALPGLRAAEAEAAAGLVRLRRALDELEAEDRRMRQRTADLARRIVELEKDVVAQARVAADATESIARLTAEDEALAADVAASGEAGAAARARQDEADGILAEAEQQLADLQTRLADITARKAALERALREAGDRATRLRAERVRLESEHAALDASGDGPTLAHLKADFDAAEVASRQAEERLNLTRAALASVREREGALRTPLAEAERKAQRLETEARTLQKLLAGGSGDLWPAILDAVSVAKGFETALGAALGEDLDASSSTAAPAHWFDTGLGENDAPLPSGVETLAAYVRAPSALTRSLRQIGVVARSDGPALRSGLKPGQRLVSREGDIWRWDGFTSAAEAPSAAARRLAEKNRLGDLEREAQAAREAAEQARDTAEALQAEVKAAIQLEVSAIEAARGARRGLDLTREQLTAAERKAAATAARRTSLIEAIDRLKLSESEAQAQAGASREALAGLTAAPALEHDLLAARAGVAERRVAASEARAQVQTLQREAELRQRRRDAISGEMKAWRERAARSDGATAEMRDRLAAAKAEESKLAEAPDSYLVERRRILSAIASAEAERKAGADRLAEGETAQGAADRTARLALDALSSVREARAAAEVRLEAARARHEEILRLIADTLDTDAAGLFGLAGIRAGDPLPTGDSIERRLTDLRSERERLGAVNLRADDELTEVSARLEELVTERDDLTEAIRRLRQAIGSLNKEGRERLLAAFEIVNGHFLTLFSTLFDGGTAELKLVDSDDPLEAGLEIFARPPGKKPQTMTLLSGGEQALTATALIFAVFLTNPSPICVLDEVDAPLDDANVERYCDLLADMARQTDTRFILITHNPITMARMDRLFGVTMAEQGVSQLVSVDLETAETIREAV
jgi:chromosome segregation protein